MSSMKPPNRWDIAGFPVFALSWYGDPEDRTSIIACSGGGGSAKTGIKNYIAVTFNSDPEQKQISTGTNLGTKLHIYKCQQTKKLWLLAAVALEKSTMGGQIHRFSLPSCELDGRMKIESPVSALAVNPMTDQMAVGCEDGTVLTFPLIDDVFESVPYDLARPLSVCRQHTQEVCSLSYAIRGPLLLSSAKDGFALLWNCQDGALLSQIKCELPAEDPNASKKKTKRARRPRAKGNVIVRGAAFGDIEGNLIYAVASYRMGSSFLFRFMRDPKAPSTFACESRLACTESPVSAMSLSDDGRLLVMGTTESSVTLWGTNDWRPLRVYKEVHGFLPTCAAARPYVVELAGEEDGVQVHARTGSGDGTIACLTLQTHTPDAVPSASGGFGVFVVLFRLFLLAIALAIVSPVAKEVHSRCRDADDALSCIVERGIYTSNIPSGMYTPPY